MHFKFLSAPKQLHEKGIIFDSAKSHNNSKSQKVLPCMWQMRPGALAKTPSSISRLLEVEAVTRLLEAGAVTEV